MLIIWLNGSIFSLLLFLGRRAKLHASDTFLIRPAQNTFTYSYSTIETTEKIWNLFKVNNKNNKATSLPSVSLSLTWTYFASLSNISFVDFKQINVCWVWRHFNALITFNLDGMSTFVLSLQLLIKVMQLDLNIFVCVLWNSLKLKVELRIVNNKFPKQELNTNKTTFIKHQSRPKTC